MSYLKIIFIFIVSTTNISCSGYTFKLNNEPQHASIFDFNDNNAAFADFFIKPTRLTFQEEEILKEHILDLFKTLYANLDDQDKHKINVDDELNNIDATFQLDFDRLLHGYDTTNIYKKFIGFNTKNSSQQYKYKAEPIIIHGASFSRVHPKPNYAFLKKQLIINSMQSKSDLRFCRINENINLDAKNHELAKIGNKLLNYQFRSELYDVQQCMASKGYIMWISERAANAWHLNTSNMY